MKTSNKILFGGILVFIIVLLSTAFYYKQLAMKGMLKGSGNLIEKVFEVSNFSKVRVEHIDFELIQGDEEKVVMTLDDNLADKYSAEVNEEGLLIIKRKNSLFITQSKTKIKVYFKHINSIRSYSGDGSGDFKGDSIFVNFSQGGKGSFTLNTNSATFYSSSGAKLNLKGKINSTVIKGSSGSQINAKELISESCIINLGSGTNAVVFVTELIKGSVSSGAGVEYYGNTKNSQIEASSGGNINRME